MDKVPDIKITLTVSYEGKEFSYSEKSYQGTGWTYYQTIEDAIHNHALAMLVKFRIDLDEYMVKGDCK